MRLHEILTIGSALVAVVAMILLVRVATRLLGPMTRGGAGQDKLALQATLALDPRRRLSLIRCEGHQLLLLTGGGADILLGWLPGTASPRADDPP